MCAQHQPRLLPMSLDVMADKIIRPNCGFASDAAQNDVECEAVEGLAARQGPKHLLGGQVLSGPKQLNSDNGQGYHRPVVIGRLPIFLFQKEFTNDGSARNFHPALT